MCSTGPLSNMVIEGEGGEGQIPEAGGMRETFQAGFTVAKKEELHF